MKYFKFHWNETRGDQYDSWGTSMWYLELDETFYPNRKIEVYQNGMRLKYDSDKIEDKFGMLGDQAVSIEEINQMKATEIAAFEFDEEWGIVVKLPED